MSRCVSAGSRRSVALAAVQPAGPRLSALRIGFNPVNLDFPLRDRDVGRPSTLWPPLVLGPGLSPVSARELRDGLRVSTGAR